MGKTKASILVGVALAALAACPGEEQIELESPIGDPAPLPGPTLAPPVPLDTVPVGHDTLPVLRQDTLRDLRQDTL